MISAQLPTIQSRFLSGADGVDRWSDQWIWDEFLHEVRVVICTYQVQHSPRNYKEEYESHFDDLDPSRHLGSWLHSNVWLGPPCLRRRSVSMFCFRAAIHVIIAHHCKDEHPANRIMRDFYHTTESNSRPGILGLTASPQTKGKNGEMEYALTHRMTTWVLLLIALGASKVTLMLLRGRQDCIAMNYYDMSFNQNL